MADLTTTAAVKEFVNISVSTDDARIGVLVTAVSAWFHGYVGHDYEATPIVAEHHSTPMSGAVVLRKPAASIQAVREGTVTLAASGYELDGERMLYRKSSGRTIDWAGGVRTIEVDYTPVSTVPDDLELAAREVCAFMVKESGWAGGASRHGLSGQANSDTGSAEYFRKVIADLPFVKLVLGRYRWNG